MAPGGRYKKVPLIEAVTLQRGFDLPMPQRKTGRYPVVASTGITSFHEKAKVKGPGVAIGRSGSIGGGQYINDDFWPLNTTLWVKDFKGNHPKFIYYLLRSLDFSSFNAGAAVPTLNRNHLAALEVAVPDITLQKKIANTLGSLDEKIELNRRINETLEQIGQALFRHYFIDNPDVKNWKIGTIDDLGDITTGKTPSKKIHEYFGKDMPFLKVPDMHNKSVVIDTDDGLSNLGVESQKNKTITKYSTCVSCIATVGVVSLSGVDLQTNQQINSIIPRQSHYRFYNYYAMSRKSDHIKTLASSGSATPNLNRGQFAKIPVVLPPDEFLKNFNKILEPVFEQIIENTHQISRLIQLRDLLLPKLISGREVSYCDRTIRENP